MADAPMQFLYESAGRRWYFAAPGQFARPGLYFWDGAKNVHADDALAAPQAGAQPAAQEPVARIASCTNHQGGRWYALEPLVNESLPIGAKVWLTPPAGTQEAEDAARYRWLRERYSSLMCSHSGTMPQIGFMAVLQHPDFKPEMLDAKIDAARSPRDPQGGA